MTKSGLEVLLEERVSLLEGKRVGLLAHPASINSCYEHIVDLFWSHPGIQLTTIMGPQHGARGETQDNMIEWEDYRDPFTGLPVHSLYGKTRQPTAEMLADLDVLVCDLQDVGSRYYTFIYTLALAMQACREAGTTVIVLDRPNPINGIDVEGPVLDPQFRSFVGLYPLPIRHGMTIGELAGYFNRECGIGCRLEVVEMKGWKRAWYFDQTGLPWVFPSPNIPAVESALVYPGMCLLEATNVSEGRGTTRPFELSGAPWVEPRNLVARLHRLDLPGAVFRPVHFIPTFHKWAGELVGGVHIHVTDRASYLPFRTGLALLKLYRELGGDRFGWNEPPYEYEKEKRPIDIISGRGDLRGLIDEGRPLEMIEATWQQDLQRFRSLRARGLIYEA